MLCRDTRGKLHVNVYEAAWQDGLAEFPVVYLHALLSLLCLPEQESISLRKDTSKRQTNRDMATV